MKRGFVWFLVVLMIGVTALSCVGCKRREYPSIAVNLNEYTMVFYDDFDGDVLDETKWAICPDQERSNVGGWWRQERVAVQDGSLVISAVNDNGQLESGAVETRGIFENKYGYYEVKFKVDKTQGLWYAFWLQCDGTRVVGDDGRDGTEIDVFEIIPYLDEFQTNFHWDGYGQDHQVGSGYPVELDESFYDEWHVVKFLWTKETYAVQLDGITTFYTDAEDNVDYGGVCQVETFMRFSAEFGDWGGEVIETLLPATLQVDYVKVYQK